MKLGVFSFGGGATMLTLVRDELVVRKKWLTDEELLSMTAISESTPGPIAVNLATYLGYRRAGFWGAFFATAGVVLPSFLVMFIISFFFQSVLQNEYVMYAFLGIKCGVVIVVIRAGYMLLKGLRKDWLGILLFTVILLLMILFAVFSVTFSSVYFILIGAFLGLVYYGAIRGRKKKEKA